MKFLIISHVFHKQWGGRLGGYGPYVREMNLWLRHVDSVRVVAPVRAEQFSAIDVIYEHRDLSVKSVPRFDFITPLNAVMSVSLLPLVLARIFFAMCWADHIHIRCPGNMGLLACFVQLLFPWKAKSAKYAGNWDPNSHQPRSFRIQRWLLSNQYLTRNMRVMVYGKWPKWSRNLRSLFTATYHVDEFGAPTPVRPLTGTMRMLFVGALSRGKQPIIAARALKVLHDRGFEARLDFFGEGVERGSVEAYAAQNGLASFVKLHGNVSGDALKEAYRTAHFLVFPSQSEGWPKAVAEAMAWGCVPITTPVSCVPYMLAFGLRGALVSADPECIAEAIQTYVSAPEKYCAAARNAMEWSRQFTLESFEIEIVRLLRGAVDNA